MENILNHTDLTHFFISAFAMTLAESQQFSHIHILAFNAVRSMSVMFLKQPVVFDVQK